MTGWTCGLLFAGMLLSFLQYGYAARRCYSLAQAPHHLHHKTCIKAHIYREINLDDGTRILDLCGPQDTGSCTFALVSLDRDRKSVGDLRQYIGEEIDARGVVEPIRGRTEIVLRKANQLQDVNPPDISESNPAHKSRVKSDRFHANPELLKSFNADQKQMAIKDPAFRTGYSY